VHRSFKRTQKKSGQAPKKRFKAHPADTNRNKSNDIPPGWKAEDWLKRSPCPGCGSRFHRNCTIPRDRGPGKGKGKGNGPPRTFGTFAVLASLMSNVTAFPTIGFGSYDTALDHGLSFVGMELFDNRPARFDALYEKKAKVRYGLMLDTGAEENLCGSAWFNRFSKEYDLNALTSYVSAQASFSGVGQGSASSQWKVSFPIGLGSFNGMLETQLVEGSGAKLPNLLGLRSMREKSCIIDLPQMILSGLFSDGKREAFAIYYVAGHLVLSCDEFMDMQSYGKPCQQKTSSLQTFSVFKATLNSTTRRIRIMSTQHSSMSSMSDSIVNIMSTKIN